jgi:2,5-diketo-D-gluconate reductase A
MHWPHAGNSGPDVQPPLAATWAAMEQLQRSGLVRAIGVSNFSPAKLQRLMAGASIQPAVCQV